jgi:hypothetical protein
VDNNGTFCQAASGQGCHTVYVRGWDNQGNITNGSYGPVCFDSVAPTVSAVDSPAAAASAYVNQAVTVTLTASDPGGSAASGIAATYYAINTGACSPSTLGSCSVYSSPLHISGQGSNYVYYFTEDVAGNFSPETYIYAFIDTAAPVTTASLSGTLSGGIYYSNVSVTLTATDNLSGVTHTYYQLDGGATTAYSSAVVVSALGSHSIKYWSVDKAGNTENGHTTTFTIASPLPVMTTPAPGSTLGTTNVTFTWTAGVGVSDYKLLLGTTGAGSSNLYASGTLTTTSTTVASIPQSGATVYAQLYAKIGTTWQTINYTYTESTVTSGPAVMSTPAPGSTLGTTNVVFTWTKGTGVVDYKLLLGTTGVGSSNIYSSGTLTTTTATVASIPANGATVYAQLYSKIGTTWSFINYTYTEASNGTPATLTTPAPGSTLGTTNVAFTWTAGTGVTQYQLFLGTTGVGSSNLYSSAVLTTTTATVASIPATGVTVYARLNSMISGSWQSKDYTYTETAATGAPATMTSPAAGSTLGTTNVVFKWTTGTGVADYKLLLGTTGAGSSNIYASGTLTTTTATVPSIPANGVTVYAQLYSKVNGTWQFINYTYTEQ